jgi:hypothetical protein
VIRHRVKENVEEAAERTARRHATPKPPKFKIGPLPLTRVKAVLAEQQIARFQLGRNTFKSRKVSSLTTIRTILAT